MESQGWKAYLHQLPCVYAEGFIACWRKFWTYYE